MRGRTDAETTGTTSARAAARTATGTRARDLARTRAVTAVIAAGLLATLLIASTGCAEEGGTVAGAQTAPDAASAAQPLDTVTAGGTGQAAATPDQVSMSFGVRVQAQDAQEALDQAGERSKAVVAALKEAGADDEDIQTQWTNLMPRYGRDSSDITGYEASVMVSVSRQGVDDVGALIESAMDAGANEMNGPAFTLSDDSMVADEAIADAVADARRRAEAMAQAAGRSLGEVRLVAETGIEQPEMYRSRHPYNYSFADGGALEAMPIEPGRLDVTARVTVVFDLD